MVEPTQSRHDLFFASLLFIQTWILTARAAMVAFFDDYVRAREGGALSNRPNVTTNATKKVFSE